MAFGDVVGTVKVANADEASSIEVNLDATPVVGNLIVIGHFTSAADSQARGTAVEARAEADGGESDEAAIYYRVVQTGDGTAWGANSGAADQQSVVVVEIEGPFEATPLDVSADSAVETGGAVGSKSTGTTGATAQNDEVAIGVVSHRTDAGSGTVSSISGWSNSFTAVGHEKNGSGQAWEMGVAMARKTLTATGTQTTTATFATNAGRAMGLIATFKKSAAGGNVAIPVPVGALRATGRTQTPLVQMANDARIVIRKS